MLCFEDLARLAAFYAIKHFLPIVRKYLELNLYTFLGSTFSQFKPVWGSISIDPTKSGELLSCFSLKSRTDYLLISTTREKKKS